MFYGFWKSLGVVASFIFGALLFWWGASNLLHFTILHKEIGALAYLALAPLFFGAALAWMSFAELLRLIRDK